jgi:putative CocE/NonD family hydrolase
VNHRRDNAAHSQAVFGAYEPPPPQYKGVTSQSLYISMRDGVRLAVEVALPKNLPPGTKIPALLSQTRYWRAMELRAPFKWFLKPEDLLPHSKGFKPFFTGQGYALVAVDVRGTGASFGTWPHPWPEDSIRDAGEIVDWIVSQPWSNGQVGGHGISYVGTTAELLAVPHHPAVKAVIPMFNHPDAYTDITFPGGVLNERFIRDWDYLDHALDQNNVPQEFGVLGRLVVKGVKPVDSDADRRLLQEAVRAHAINGDVYCVAQEVTYRDERPGGVGICVDDLTVHRFKQEAEQANVATFGWGSWMDAGTADAVIRRFLTFESAQRAVIGAWEHGSRFHASPYQPSDLPADPPLPAQWREMLRFFDGYLKETGSGVQSEKALFYYTMGQEKWKKTAIWPPEGTTTQRWYLAEDNVLSLDEPTTETDGDSYTVDFEASTGEHNRWWEMGAIFDQTVIYPDRAEADRRLLTYTTPPLDEDIEITGYPVVTLYVTSTETDGVFYVYLEDLDESGRVTYVTEGQLRAIHRKVSADRPPYRLQVPYHSFKQADALPLVPGEIAEISLGLHPTSVLIRKGHRIRIAIAGHDKGTFVRIPAEGRPVITVARNRRYTSYIDLPVVRRPG